MSANDTIFVPDVELPTFGRFRAIGELGSGAMGAVYRAHDDTLGRDVAIKTLHTIRDDATLRERFLREARAVSVLSHPNIGAVYDADPMLAIDLESNRARAALGVLGKLQEGSSLGEVLGIELERAMHVHDFDEHLRDVRTAFPLQRSSEEAGKRTIATTDGLAVLEAARRIPPPPLVVAIAPVAAIEEDLDELQKLSSRWGRADRLLHQPARRNDAEWFRPWSDH